MSMELGPYTNFHELNLDWFLDEFNKVLAEWADMNKRFSDLNAAFNDLSNYVHDYRWRYRKKLTTSWILWRKMEVYML